MKNIFLHQRDAEANEIPHQRDKEESYAEKLKKLAGLNSLKDKKTVKALKFQIFFLIIGNLLIFLLLLLIYLIL